MLLVFGGTTEGRKAAEVLEEAGSPYYYSTKTGEQDLTLHHGQRIDGALDREAMRAFCREHLIRLVVDAAHPFASQLHATIAEVTAELHIPLVRYERIYPPRDPDITWIDDYAELASILHPPVTLLATTGVQSIGRLKPLEDKGISIIYRILPRESSVALAEQQGATADQLCFYEDNGTLDVGADVILLKESGLTGGFVEKVQAARRQGMRIMALKRPPLTAKAAFVVNGQHGLRRAVEQLLPAFFPLHSGLTTGTCATAAAVAAALSLLSDEQPAAVPVILPDGETIDVPVAYHDGYASCYKAAGDDPDVTDGIEIRASVSLQPASNEREPIEILGGEGVGIITLPGFDYPPGSPAINKVPRMMISRNLEPFGAALQVTSSVPQGAETARRTFNPRLGIEGGISIIGVSGVVKPFSEEAFIDSIRKCMTIAKASGTDRVVINSGGKSERFISDCYPQLPRQAFVQYGNYIGETLRIAHELGIRRVTLGVMLGKAVKLAAGHLDTHSRRAVMDLDFVGKLLNEAGVSIDISRITLARELWEMIPAHQLERFASVVISHCGQYCRPLLPDGELTILLIDDNGTIYPTPSFS